MGTGGANVDGGGCTRADASGDSGVVAGSGGGSINGAGVGAATKPAVLSASAVPVSTASGSDGKPGASLARRFRTTAIFCSIFSLSFRSWASDAVIATIRLRASS